MVYSRADVHWELIFVKGVGLCLAAFPPPGCPADQHHLLKRLFYCVALAPLHRQLMYLCGSISGLSVLVH